MHIYIRLFRRFRFENTFTKINYKIKIRTRAVVTVTNTNTVTVYRIIFIRHVSLISVTTILYQDTRST